MRLWPKEPFWQVVSLLVIAFLLIVFGIPYLPPLLGMPSAPVPNSVVVQYMLTALVGGPFFFWLLRRTRAQQGGWA